MAGIVFKIIIFSITFLYGFTIQWIMTLVDLNGIRLNYISEGEGEPVVLLTGFSGNTDFWRSLIPMLSSEYRVIAIDNRGAGLTEYKGQFTGDDMVNDVASLLNHLEIFKAHIVGWSMGGHIAQSFALRFPERVRTLSLISAYLYRPSRSSYMMNSMLKCGFENLNADYLMMMVNAFCFTEDFFAKKQADGKTVPLPKGVSINGLIDQMRVLDAFDTRKTVKNITSPTLEIHGLSDIMVEPKMGDEIVSLIPGCKSYRIPNVGHNIHPALYVEALKEHLASIKK